MASAKKKAVKLVQGVVFPNNITLNAISTAKVYEYLEQQQ